MCKSENIFYFFEIESFVEVLNTENPEIGSTMSTT